MAELKFINPASPGYSLDAGKQQCEITAAKPSVREQLKATGELVRKRGANSTNKAIGNAVHTAAKNPVKDKNAEI